MPQGAASCVEHYGDTCCRRIADQGAVCLGGQPVRQAAAEHDGGGRVEQVPVVHGQPAEFLGSDVRGGLGKAGGLSVPAVRDLDYSARLSADPGELGRHSGPGQLVPDPLTR